MCKPAKRQVKALCIRCIYFVVCLCVFGCQVQQKRPAEIPFRSDIAERIAVVPADFTLMPLHDVFTLEQLAWLQVHRHQLSDAVNAEIRRGSTLAIQMAVYLHLETAVPVLRERLLTLRSTYMWEGHDYSTEVAFMWESQYPWHSIYIWAIVGIAQAPLSEVIKLTDAERATLEAKAADAKPYNARPFPTNDKWVGGHAWCAKWLLTQLVPDRKGVE